MTLHNKIHTVQIIFLLSVVKKMDILENMITQNIYNFFILIKTMRKFLIKLDILLC